MKKSKNNEVKEVATNTAWMLVAQMIRIALQGIYFILVARALGAEAFGGFASVLAMVGIVVPFAGLGYGNILVKNVARHPETMKTSYGNMLFMVFITGSLLTVLLLVLKPLFLSPAIPLLVVLFVAISDLVLTKVLFAVGFAFQAINRLNITSIILVLFFTLRTLAALIMLETIEHPSVFSWSCFYVGSSFFSAIIATLVMYRRFGMPQVDIRHACGDIVEGFFFSVSQSGQVINNNMDKIMLGRMSTLTATGIYGAAYRLIDVAMAPTRSLLLATYSRFFKYGEEGISGSIKMATRLVPIAGVYGIIATVGIYIIASIVPYILGDEYSASVVALRWLAPIPLLKSLHFVASDTLSSAGLQKLRSAMIFVAASTNVALNIWLIPAYSWKGAAWSSLASDGLLMVGLWLIVLQHYKQSQKS